MKILNLKNKNGITLIALVITIIVLLILAGISISMLAGDNSILSKAGQAKKDTIEGQEKEQVELAYVSAAINKLGDSVTDEELQTELNSSVGSGKTTVSSNDDTTLNVYFKETEHNYNVDKGIVSKVNTSDPDEDLEKLKQYFIGKGYSDCMEVIYDEDGNRVSSHYKNNEIIPDASTSIQFAEYGIKYHNRKYEIIGNGEDDEYIVTDVADITGMAIVFGFRNNYIKFLPKNNQTWYEWATDVENSIDLAIKTGETITLKSLIQKVGNNHYISSAIVTANGTSIKFSLSKKRYGDVSVQSNEVIKEGLYYIYSVQ